MSDISQLSLELKGRHYGNGALKIEPSALKSAVVLVNDQEISQARFDEISGLLLLGRKEEAARAATSYCKEVSSVPSEVWEKARYALEQIRDRRK